MPAAGPDIRVGHKHVTRLMRGARLRDAALCKFAVTTLSLEAGFC